MSQPVTITGLGTDLGFPFNYKAMPDLSQNGDSGGPIEVVDPNGGAGAHRVVAVVDTDTIDENINEEEPIDLFARVDLVYGQIAAQIGAHGGVPSGPDASDAGESPAEGGVPPSDGNLPPLDVNVPSQGEGDGPVPPSTGAWTGALPPSDGSGAGCSVARPHTVDACPWLVALAFARISR